MQIIERLREKFLSSKEITSEAEAAGIFGSLARGDFNERSDIDIFVVLKEEDFIHQEDPHMLWYRRMRELTKEFNREVTLLVYTPESLKEICNWYVLRLASEGIILYDKANITKLFKRIVEKAKEKGFEEKELAGSKYWSIENLKIGETVELSLKDE